MEEYPTTVEVAKKHSYNFWKGKPVSKFSDVVYNSNIIEQDISTRTNYSSETPLTLPKGLEWKEITTFSESMLSQVCLFLNTYSTQSDKQKFKMEYTTDLIRLALGEQFGTILMIISQKTGSIFGLIGYTINNLTVFSQSEGFGVCHFLCVHPQYRKKNVANILIDEGIKRLLHGKYGLSLSCFMTEKCVPSPVCCVRQYRRPINYELLHRLKFCALQKDCTEKDIKNFEVHGAIDQSIIKMTTDHLKQVLKLLKEFNMRFNVCRNYTIDELESELINNASVNSYVVLGKDMTVIDFFSFYDVNYLQCDKEKTEVIKSRNFYLYSCVNATQDFILQNSLRIAQRDKIDVVNTTDIMLISNSILTKEFDVGEDSDSDDRGKVYEYKFVRGGSKIYLNFFNWKCPKIKPVQLSLFWFNY
jgi:glycylpeptide N-tetradecanoyltransferase